MRYSGKREAIIDDLRSRDDHPTADMIYDDIRRIYPHISLGTVYRNLAELCARGEVRRIETGGKERYDGNLSPHNHFYCTSCGKLVDISSQISVSGIRGAEDEVGGEIDAASITFRGICRGCLDKKTK